MIVGDVDLRKLRAGAKSLAVVSSARRTAGLLAFVRILRENFEGVLKANSLDYQKFSQSELATPALLDRLLLTPGRLEEMAQAVELIARAKDPVGECVESKVLFNGLRVERVRSPLGVIFLIFESRPNVAVDAWALALRSGNAILLKPGKESYHSILALEQLILRALHEVGLPQESLKFVSSSTRDQIKEFLHATKWLDVVIPRGGEKLIEFVTEHSRIPVIKNDRGMCHIYVDEGADLDMALSIVRNAKTQRPGVCNAMETLLLHKKIAGGLLSRMAQDVKLSQVTWVGCAETCKLAPRAVPVVAKSYDTEYLDLQMNLRVVPSLDEAIRHIDEHGSRHSEAIVTKDESRAERFMNEVDAAAVYWNASTRFTDGGCLGLGAEMGISTQKLHVRGPVGAMDLTSLRWLIRGEGQIREN